MLCYFKEGKKGRNDGSLKCMKENSPNMLFIPEDRDREGSVNSDQLGGHMKGMERSPSSQQCPHVYGSNKDGTVK